MTAVIVADRRLGWTRTVRGGRAQLGLMGGCTGGGVRSPRVRKSGRIREGRSRSATKAMSAKARDGIDVIVVVVEVCNVQMGRPSV